MKENVPITNPVEMVDPNWMSKTGEFIRKAERGEQGMNKRDMKRDAELAEQCYVNPSEFDYKKYAALIRADEREECAKVCQRFSDRLMSAGECADAIRARSKA
jgi:hypothetical protein